MDTKSKKSKPFSIWLCFFMGINIVVSLIIISIAALSVEYFNFNDFKAAFGSDFKNTGYFKKALSRDFDYLGQLITNFTDDKTTSSEGEAGSIEEAADNAEITNYYLESLDQEGANLIYFAQDTKTGRIITNSAKTLDVTENGLSSMPEGYDFYFYYNGSKFIAEKDGLHSLDIYRNDSGYSKLSLWRYIDKNYRGRIQGIQNCRILLIINKDIIENPYGHSYLYQQKLSSHAAKWIISGIAIIFLFGLAILILSIIKRKTKREYDIKIAGFTGQLWIEFKIIVSILIAMLMLSIPGIGYSNNITSILIPMLIAGICCWWFYFMLVDLIVNKRKAFTNNSINSLIKRYRSIEMKKPFQKGMMSRIYVMMISEAVLVIIALISTGIAFGGSGFAAFLAIVFIFTGMYIMYRYLRRYGNTIKDIGHIMDQIEEIKNGQMREAHAVMPGADLFPAQDNLNKIQDGFSKAVEGKIRSERMKVELITNVSHDLKTPLTSIISYIDLLSQEDELPQHVKDYIKILSQKSERLKTLILDLFDLSKVNSGNIVIEKERLDLGRVVTQTLADMNDEIEQSGLAFKVRIHDEPIYIMSDGSKLYRVFQNLVSNALKYSLTGSRVYIDVMVNEDKAIAIIRNTANYEMNFSEDEIVERFVRGDEARTTEGTGLGLAIAQSFTHACGGNLTIKLDGDLFKVILTFNICC